MTGRRPTLASDARIAGLMAELDGLSARLAEATASLRPMRPDLGRLPGHVLGAREAAEDLVSALDSLFNAATDAAVEAYERRLIAENERLTGDERRMPPILSRRLCSFESSSDSTRGPRPTPPDAA